MEMNKLGYNFQRFFRELSEIFDLGDLLLEQKIESIQIFLKNLEQDRDFLFVRVFIESIKTVIYYYFTMSDIL